MKFMRNETVERFHVCPPYGVECPARVPLCFGLACGAFFLCLRPAFFQRVLVRVRVFLNACVSSVSVSVSVYFDACKAETCDVCTVVEERCLGICLHQTAFPQCEPNLSVDAVRPRGCCESVPHRNGPKPSGSSWVPSRKRWRWQVVE